MKSNQIRFQVIFFLHILLRPQMHTGWKSRGRGPYCFFPKILCTVSTMLYTFVGWMPYCFFIDKFFLFIPQSLHRGSIFIIDFSRLRWRNKQLIRMNEYCKKKENFWLRNYKSLHPIYTTSKTSYFSDKSLTVGCFTILKFIFASLNR